MLSVTRVGVRCMSSLALRVPSTDAAAAAGKIVSPMWARFNADNTSGVDAAELTKVQVLSNVAADAASRTVIIHRVGQSAMTSGMSGSRWWGLRMSAVPKWSNPLMGWTSSADTLSQVAMLTRFETPEQAVQFCVRNGWRFEFNPGALVERKPGAVDNQYAYNFLSREVQAKMKEVGARRARHIFANSEAYKGAWVNLRRTQFGKEEWKPADYQTPAAWTGPAWPKAKYAAH